MDSEVKISEEALENVFILRFEGRLDAVTSPPAENKIFEYIDGGKKNIIINMEKVDYLSSAGMRLLLASMKKIKELEGKIVVCSLTDMVMDVIKIAGFDHILEIQEDEEKAKTLF